MNPSEVALSNTQRIQSNCVLLQIAARKAGLQDYDIVANNDLAKISWGGHNRSQRQVALSMGKNVADALKLVELTAWPELGNQPRPKGPLKLVTTKGRRAKREQLIVGPAVPWEAMSDAGLVSAAVAVMRRLDEQ